MLPDGYTKKKCANGLFPLQLNEIIRHMVMLKIVCFKASLKLSELLNQSIKLEPATAAVLNKAIGNTFYVFFLY